MKSRFPSLSFLIALFTLTASAAWAGNAKVQVCHIPPGNPGNFHTITISENALQAHLGHGDLAGACFAHCNTLCSDGNLCTIDACDASEHCISTHPPVNCDDSNLCTVDSCNPASGCASVPKTCADGDNCTVDACDPLTGSCVAPPVACPAGQSCSPANGQCTGSGVTCPCSSLSGFDRVLEDVTICVEFPGLVFLTTNPTWIFSIEASNTTCTVRGYDGVQSLPVTPEESAFCTQFLRDYAASHDIDCE